MSRLDKFKSLSEHTIYGRLLKRLNNEELEICLDFLTKYAEFDVGQYEIKVLRLGLDQLNKPKRLGEMAELLLVCRDKE